MEDKLKPIHGNLLLLFGAVLLLSIGSYVQMNDLITGLLITELFLIMSPALLFAYILRVNIKEEFRFNGFTLKEFILVTVIIIALYPTANFFNLLANIVLSGVGELPANPIEIPTDTSTFFVYLLVIAGSAGLCEEVMFRGFIMRSYETLGKGQAIVLSGVLFGFFHFNLQNLLGPIFLGIVIGYIVMRTNSLWMGIYAHMLNNAFSLSLGFLLTSGAPQEAAEPITTQMLLMAAGALLFFAAFFGFFAVLALMGLKKITEEKQQKPNKKTVEDNTEDILYENTSSKIGTWWPVFIFALLFIAMAYIQILIIKDPSILTYMY